MSETITQEEQDKRVEEVYRLLLMFTRRKIILRYARERGWGVGTRTVDKYIACAKQELATRRKETRDEMYAEAQNRLGDLYQKSYQAGDYKNCLQVLKEKNDLAGLHTEQVQHTVTVTDMDMLRKQVDAAISLDPNARDRLTARLSPGTDEEESEE